MLSYTIGGYNTFKLRTAQIPVSASLLLMSLQDMQGLNNTSFFVMDKSGSTWDYDACESIATITFDLSVNTANFTTGSEYRATLTPYISGSGYTDPVWHGSIQVFASQSIDKANYENQIPLDGNEKSALSTNEYVILT